MAIPCSAKGYGNNSVAKNVFRLKFSTALSAAPTYEAYDGGTYPAVGSGTTTANTIFAGTAGNSSKPMLCLVDTNDGATAPTSAWKPGSATAGSANPNRLKGTTNYVTATNTPGANDFITWNQVLELPSDATTSSTMAADLLIRYKYTGTAPTLTWAVNDDGAGGTDGTPVWTTLTPATHGTRHCDSGTVSGGPYYLSIPASSTVDSAMGWVTV